MIIYFWGIAFCFFCFFFEGFCCYVWGGETSLIFPPRPRIQLWESEFVKIVFNPDVCAPTTWNMLCYSNSRYIFLKLDPQDSGSVLDILPIFVDVDFHLLQGMVSKWINVCLRRPLDLQDVSAFRDSKNFRYGNVSFKGKMWVPLGECPPPVCPI